MKGSFSTVRKIRGFRGLYLHYCCCLGILPKGSKHRPLSPELREECRCLDRISRQTQLICQKKLDTAGDVSDFISRKQAEIAELGAIRQKCYNRLRRCDSREEIAQINHLIQTLPPKCKMVFVLAKMERLPYKEIAKILNISVKTINIHIAKALEIISEGLRK